MGTSAGGVDTNTRMRGGNIVISLSAAPFWKDRKWTVERTARRTRSENSAAAGDTLTLDREQCLTLKMEFPFIGKGALTADVGRTRRSGSRSERARTLDAGVRWPLSDTMSLSATYRKQSDTDAQYAQSSTRARDMIVKMDGNLDW